MSLCKAMLPRRVAAHHLSVDPELLAHRHELSMELWPLIRHNQLWRSIVRNPYFHEPPCHMLGFPAFEHASRVP